MIWKMIGKGIYYDADKGGAGGNSGDKGAGNEGSGSGDPAHNSNGAGADAKSYTQDELNRMFSERARQAEGSLLKKLGFEKVEDAQAALNRLKTIDDGQKTDLQKAQDKVAELTKNNETLINQQKAQIAQYEVMLAAGKLGIVDPDAAFKLLDTSKLEFNKEGKPTNTEQLLRDLVKEKPWLAGSGSSASNHAKNHGGDTSDAVVNAARRAAGLPVEEKK